MRSVEVRWTVERERGWQQCTIADRSALHLVELRAPCLPGGRVIRRR